MGTVINYAPTTTKTTFSDGTTAEQLTEASVATTETIIDEDDWQTQLMDLISKIGLELDEVRSLFYGQQRITGPGRCVSPDPPPMFTMGPNGEIYCNAIQLFADFAKTKPYSVSEVICAGSAVYAKGKTNGKWYAFDEGTKKFVAAAEPYDTTILT